VDVMLGGGRKFFLPKSAGGDRKDSLNLLYVTAHAGYDVVLNKTSFQQSSYSKILGLFSAEGLLNKANEPNLVDLTRKAIRILARNKKGFFLMVEGSQIDWAGHENQFDELVKQVLAFDEAIGVALSFAEKENETLVVVTADHETGGMSICGGKVDGSQIKIDWISTDHTGQMVPLFAAGSNAYLFTGIKDNTEILRIFARLLGIENFPRKIEVVD
jgi:alkaline phosphatase